MSRVKIEDDLPVPVCIQRFNHLMHIAFVLSVNINSLLVKLFPYVYHGILFIQDLFQRLFIHGFAV